MTLMTSFGKNTPDDDKPVEVNIHNPVLYRYYLKEMGFVLDINSSAKIYVTKSNQSPPDSATSATESNPSTILLDLQDEYPYRGQYQ